MQNLNHKLSTIAIAISALALGACTTLPGTGGTGLFPSGPTTWTQPEAQQVQQVRIGKVLAVRAVEIQPSGERTGVGSAVGALVGGLVGHQVGGGKGKTLATVAGAAGGAVAGNVATRHLYHQPGIAVTVKITSGWGQGEVEQITQAVAAGVSIQPGDRVEIIGSGCGPWSSDCRDPARVIPLPVAAVARGE